MELLRRQQQSRGAPSLQDGEADMRRFVDTLPFSLTGAQARVVDEIAADLSRPVPMLRLVQGDVGSGKTVVAACAARQAIACGHQVAIMAPTEILAEQHRENFATWFEPLGITPCLLTGRIKGRARQGVLEAVGTGSAQLVIGTHALFQ